MLNDENLDCAFDHLVADHDDIEVDRAARVRVLLLDDGELEIGGVGRSDHRVAIGHHRVLRDVFRRRASWLAAAVIVECVCCDFRDVVLSVCARIVDGV